jgi:hypothetical protein
MVKERKEVDISDMPDVLRLAREVQATEEPYVLRRDGEEIAALYLKGRPPAVELLGSLFPDGLALSADGIPKLDEKLAP